MSVQGSHGHSHTKGQQSLRLTKGAKKVLEVLERTDELSSAQDIHGALRSEEESPPGLTTVYRSLESLVQLGLVQAVDFGDGERRYEMVKPGEHHHHLVCRSCGSTVEVSGFEVEAWAAEVAAAHGFSDVHHTIELFGTCADCSTGSSDARQNRM